MNSINYVCLEVVFQYLSNEDLKSAPIANKLFRGMARFHDFFRSLSIALKENQTPDRFSKPLRTILKDYLQKIPNLTVEGQCSNDQRVNALILQKTPFGFYMDAKEFTLMARIIIVSGKKFKECFLQYSFSKKLWVGVHYTDGKKYYSDSRKIEEAHEKQLFNFLEAVTSQKTCKVANLQKLLLGTNVAVFQPDVKEVALFREKSEEKVERKDR